MSVKDNGEFACCDDSLSFTEPVLGLLSFGDYLGSDLPSPEVAG
jgi:hypothetical protein